MKFYKIKYLTNVDQKITAIFNTLNIINLLPCIRFIKNGKHHNIKNAAYINPKGYKEFFLNGISYGDKYSFTKSSWHKFIKLKAFL